MVRKLDTTIERPRPRALTRRGERSMGSGQLMNALPKVVIAGIVVSLLSACGGSGGDDSFSGGNTITGTLRVTAGTQLATREIPRAATADIGGLAPAGAGVTVQLVRLDDQGQNPAVLASTTTDSAGAYSFTGGNVPAPASNLAVQVVGQSTDMQALVTGSQVDISPASEAVFEEVTGTGGVSLTNFTLEELAALNGVVAGTGLDVSGDTFATAVTALKAAAGSTLTTLTAQFAASSLITALQNHSYNTLGHLSTLSASPGPSIGLATRYGQGLINATNVMATGSVEAVIAPLADNLNAGGTTTLIQGAAGTDVSQEGWVHMPTATGQVVVADTSGNGGIGAVNAADTFMVYPLTGNTQSGASYATLTRGLHIVTRGYTPAGPGAAGSSPFDTGDLDVGGGTAYHLMELSQTLASDSGLHTNLGDQVTVSVATGDVVLTNDVNGPSFQNQGPYGTLAANSLTTDSLSLDLGSSAITSQTGTGAVAEGSGGYYYVSPFGNLTLRDNTTDNPILGVGNVVSGGEIFVFALTPDDRLGAPFPASIAGTGSHTVDVAIRRLGSSVTLSAGTYNVVKYAYYLRSGTVVGSGFQTGTIAVAADGTLSGGALIRSEGDIDILAALADPATALTTASSTAPESASGAVTLAGADNTATLNASFGDEALTGSGAITADGSVAVFAVDIADDTPSDIGRGLLFLVRQP
jgi:hypothetical protein